MIDINNILRKLNVLNSKKNTHNINTLMNLMNMNQKTSKFFNLKIIFAFSILFIVSISMTFKKIIEFLLKLLKSCNLTVFVQ